MTGFPWKEHTATSVLACKHLNATLCQCRCLRACLYQVYVSQGRYVGERWGQGVGSYLKNFLFAFDLDLSVVRCCLCYLQGVPLSVSGELWGVCPFKSYYNNRLMGWSGAKASTLVPKRVRTEVKKNGKGNSHNIPLKLSFPEQHCSYSLFEDRKFSLMHTSISNNHVFVALLLEKGSQKQSRGREIWI